MSGGRRQGQTAGTKTRGGGVRQVDQGRTTAGSLTLAAAINKHVAEANGAWQLINTLKPRPPPGTPGTRKGATGHRDGPVSGTPD